jgi:hypothetical protein
MVKIRDDWKLSTMMSLVAIALSIFVICKKCNSSNSEREQGKPVAKESVTD